MTMQADCGLTYGTLYLYHTLPEKTYVNKHSTVPLVLQLGVLSTHQIAADASLEVGKDLGQFFLAHFLQLTEYAGLEEHLRVSNAVIVTHVQRGQDFLRRDFAVDESTWNRIRSQNRVTV